MSQACVRLATRGCGGLIDAALTAWGRVTRQSKAACLTVITAHVTRTLGRGGGDQVASQGLTAAASGTDPARFDSFADALAALIAACGNPPQADIARAAAWRRLAYRNFDQPLEEFVARSGEGRKTQAPTKREAPAGSRPERYAKLLSSWLAGTLPDRSVAPTLKADSGERISLKNWRPGDARLEFSDAAVVLCVLGQERTLSAWEGLRRRSPTAYRPRQR